MAGVLLFADWQKLGEERWRQSTIPRLIPSWVAPGCHSCSHCHARECTPSLSDWGIVSLQIKRLCLCEQTKLLGVIWFHCGRCSSVTMWSWVLWFLILFLWLFIKVTQYTNSLSGWFLCKDIAGASKSSQCTHLTRISSCWVLQWVSWWEGLRWLLK